MKNSLTCFGVGDGWSCADRNHASFLYRLGQTSILIDCGEPVDRTLKASGLSYDSVNAIFLSHLHSDHIGGLFMLMQGFWLAGRRKELPLHLPGAAIKPLRAMLDAAMLFSELLPFKLKLLPMKSGKSTAVQKVKVTPFPTSHLDGFRARFRKKYSNDFAAFCFLIEAGKLRIGHSADLGKTKDLDPLLAQPLDLLVCELSHFEPQEMFAYLSGRQIGQIVFVHLSSAQWENLAKLRRLAAKMLPGNPHRFARDGDLIEL
ncbi:MAG: MBL fold metallo-hydrolase [Verrucomicrobiota bacterium]